MKTQKQFFNQVLTLLLGAGLFAAVSTAHADELAGRATAYPKDSAVGATYSILAAAWQQWAGSMPASAHPLFDTAPCSQGQYGSVWFLGGRFCREGDTDCADRPATRSCEVPKGTALFFPVVNFSCLNAEAEKGFCGDSPVVADMRAHIGNSIDQTVDLQVMVDGKPIKADLKKEYRVRSPVYPAVLPADNLLEAIGEGIPAGTYWGVDDGVYVLLQGLTAGQHVVTFHGKFPQYDFVLDFTYNLTVK